MTAGLDGYAYDDLAITSSYLFWTESVTGDVWRYALGAGTKSLVATGQGTPYRLAVDSTNVYWLTGNNLGTTSQTFNVAWTSQTLPSPPMSTPTGMGEAFGLATDGTSLFIPALIGGKYEMIAVKIATGMQSLVADTDLSLDVRVGGGALFWFDDADTTIYGLRLPD